MAKFKKAIVSLVACVLMMSALTLNVGATKVTVTVNGAKGIAYLNVNSTTATATTSFNSTGGSTSTTIIGRYYVKGTTDIKTTTNGGGGTTAAMASITNAGGTWVSVTSNHSFAYGSEHVAIDVEW